MEVMAARGDQTLCFGLEARGLAQPNSDEKPHAVLQLRKENIHGTAYNLVGCQTRLKQPAKKVFGLIPP